MATQPTSAASQKSAGKNKRNFRIAILVTLALLLGAIAFGIYALSRAMFVTNPRLTLQHIELKNSSGTYWGAHQTELFRDLGLKKGMPLADIHADMLRQDLLRRPNISMAEVEILQPDSILITITERIPAALLDAIWVVDTDGFLLRRTETVQNVPLPVIKERKEHTPYVWVYQKHEPRKELLPALHLVRAIQKNPQLQLQILLVNADRKLEARMSYMEQPPCRVIFPAEKSEQEYDFLIARFLDAITQMRTSGDLSTSFDVSFDGRVIVK